MTICFLVILSLMSNDSSFLPLTHLDIVKSGIDLNTGPIPPDFTMKPPLKQNVQVFPVNYLLESLFYPPPLVSDLDIPDDNKLWVEQFLRILLHKWSICLHVRCRTEMKEQMRKAEIEMKLMALMLQRSREVQLLGNGGHCYQPEEHHT